MRKTTMMKIVILDYEIGEVFIYNFDPNVWEDGSDFIESKNNSHSINNCQWMVVDNLVIHSK